MAFQQILIAFFGCIPFEEKTSLDLYEKMNLLIRKSTTFHKENKNNTFVRGMLLFYFNENIWTSNQNSKSKT